LGAKRIAQPSCSSMHVAKIRLGYSVRGLLVLQILLLRPDVSDVGLLSLPLARGHHA
jgi:hypothetical protein